MSRGRTVGIAVLAAAVTGAAAWGFWPRPVAVQTAVATRDTMQVRVEEEGRTRVRDRYVVSAPVAGYVRRIELEVGDPVERQQRVAELEPLRSQVLDPRSRAEAEASVAAARARLARVEAEALAAEVDAEEASAEYERRQRLHASGRVSDEEIARARSRAQQTAAALNSARHAVDVARFELDAALAALRYSAAATDSEVADLVDVRSPVAGEVLEVIRESEGVVNAGAPLLAIGDPDEIEVEVDVLSSDAVRMSPGTPVEFRRWGGENVLRGEVRRVEPRGFTKISALGVEEQRVRVIADITSPRAQWQRLGDGYRVEASFIVWQEEDVLQVSSSALFRHADGWALFRIEDGRARLTPVRTGRQNGRVAQVLDGIESGTPVVVHPDDSIADGTRVRGYGNNRT